MVTGRKSARVISEPVDPAVPDGVGEPVVVMHAPSAADVPHPGLRDLLITLDLGVAMASDLDGTIRHWSKGCERLYGWSAAEAIGRNSHELLQTKFLQPLEEVEGILLAQQEWHGELRHVTKDGRELVVMARKVLRVSSAGTPLAVMESMSDVTEQRAAEALVAAQTARLTQASKMEALGLMAGGVAHDFNNILQMLQTSLEVAGQSGGDERRRLIELAQSVGRRGAGITSRLLTFARQSELHARPLVPATVLSHLAEMVGPLIGPSITVRIDAPFELPNILADLGQIETALVNLVTNARDALPRGGTLLLRARAQTVPEATSYPAGLAPGAYVCLSVIDNGQGMSAEVLSRVTEPFFTTKAVGKGTGLGLATAFGLAAQSGGAFEISSTLHVGTTATLWLPQASESVAQTPSERIRILLVEDEQELRDMLADTLEKAGYDVVSVESVDDAFELFDHGVVPQLIITDFATPGSRDGLDLIVAASRLKTKTPILLITGYVTGVGGEEVDRLQEQFGFSTLRKPFSLAALLQRTRSLCEERLARS